MLLVLGCRLLYELHESGPHAIIPVCTRKVEHLPTAAFDDRLAFAVPGGLPFVITELSVDGSR